MKKEPYFVGTREGTSTGVFAISPSLCVSLADGLAHHADLANRGWEWGNESAGALALAHALLLTVTGDEELSRAAAPHFLADVVKWLEREGWELSAASIRLYAELWLASPVRAHNTWGFRRTFKLN